MPMLFESTTIKQMILANRFVRSATWEGMAGEDGSCTPRLVELMIIDFHVHTARYQTMTQALVDLLRETWGDRLEWMIETYSSPKAFLDLMDESGIDYAVILAEIAPITTGIAENEYVAEFCSRSERLIPFASINPYTCTRPAEELVNLVRDYGFQGLKLYPTYKVVYGSDWPGVPGIRENIQPIKGLSITQEAKQRILGENAVRLLKISE